MSRTAMGLVRDERGATSIEYALIAGLIGLVIITGASTLGKNVQAKFTGVATAVQNAK